MSSFWTVDPVTDRVECSWRGKAFWLDVKRQLTEGEDRKVKAAAFKGIRTTQPTTRARRLNEPPPETVLEPNLEHSSHIRTLTWVVDWSLADDNNTKLPLDLDTVKNLHPKLYEVIEGVINTRVLEADDEKKAPSGERRPKAISA